MSEATIIPIFPLELVLYPSEQLPLHIFEERYREMVAYCLEDEAPFGILLVNEGKMANIGCTAHIEQVVTKYDDGRLDIIVHGMQRFRVEEVFENKVYMTASIDFLREPDEPVKNDMRERVITQHMRLLELAGRKVRPTTYQNLTGVSFFIAHNAGLKPNQKQEILELNSENERISYLAGHLEMLIPRVEEFEDVRKKVQSNGHFKDFPSEDLPSVD
ncbi:MAG: LON peptidase substrate-binding domain-containing protein [Bacteroidota bacterium]